MPDHDTDTELAPLSDSATVKQLAWSDERDTDELSWPDVPAGQPIPLSSRYSLRIAFLGATLAVAAYAAASLFHRPAENPAAAHTAPPAATTTLTAAPPEPAPQYQSTPSAAELVPPAPSRDDLFITDMHRHGIPYKSGDADAILSAHMVCNELAGGQTLAEQTGVVQRALGWSFTDANAFVFDAARTYCPEDAR